MEGEAVGRGSTMKQVGGEEKLIGSAGYSKETSVTEEGVGGGLFTGTLWGPRSPLMPFFLD